MSGSDKDDDFKTDERGIFQDKFSDYNGNGKSVSMKILNVHCCRNVTVFSINSVCFTVVCCYVHLLCNPAEADW